MKGPMKGAAIGHAKQRIKTGRYLGISEPGIIGAEPPNPIINDLVIMPDIEMRLEAFVRVGHAIVVFPGAGTAEEILYLVGLLMAPENDGLPFPFDFHGPRVSSSLFEMIDAFLVNCLGESVRECYEIILGDAESVAMPCKKGFEVFASSARQGMMPLLQLAAFVPRHYSAALNRPINPWLHWT